MLLLPSCLPEPESHQGARSQRPSPEDSSGGGGCEAEPMVGAATPPQARGEREGGPAHLGAACDPGASATTFALEDKAEASLLGVWANFKGSGMSAVSSLLLPQQACSVMCPVGISFIIFPLHLINPHPVMNLEISIKHIITNQHRAGGSWWLLTAGRAVRLWAWTPARRQGSHAVPVPHLFLATSGRS